MLCPFCQWPLEHCETEEHHPDRTNRPDYTITVHKECHWAYHYNRGDFARWGQRGYQVALDRHPNFHHLGGLARAGSKRDRFGRFA